MATVYHKTVSQENVKTPDLEYMQKLRIWGISCNGIPQKRESDIRQENDGHLKQICPIGYHNAGGKQMSDYSFAPPRWRSDIAQELSMIRSDKSFIYLV